jgi:hypothetical protein
VILKQLSVAKLDRKFLAVKEANNTLLCSENLAIQPYTEANPESNSQPEIIFLYGVF